MNILEAILLGFVQGATEFLPISSSGHLVLIPYFLKIAKPSLLFDLILHIGTLVALTVYFWKDLLSIIRSFWLSFSKRASSESYERPLKLFFLLVLATVPAVVIGFLFKDFFESLFLEPRSVSLFMIATGAILFVSEKIGKKSRGIDSMDWKDGLLIGLAQALSIIPGISRSGATISAGLSRNLRREDSTRFSFLMAIPIIAGTGLFKVIDSYKTISHQTVLPMIVGFLAAFLTGFLAIRFLIGFVQTNKLSYFAYYCWAFGLLSFVSIYYQKGS